MLFVSELSHRPFVFSKLKRILPDGSFSSRVWRALGEELNARLRYSEWEFAEHDPVAALSIWATQHGGLDPESLASTDGSYLDDKGETIPSSVKPSFSAAEQLAAYGLWLLEVEMECLGQIPEGDTDVGPISERNMYGWRRDEVIEHRAACMLFAYQALYYVHGIQSGAQPTADEVRQAEQVDFSALGKAGALKRHERTKQLKAWTLERYQTGKWPSANAAAHALKNDVIAYSKTIGAGLTESNGQRTIAEWIRASQKSS